MRARRPSQGPRSHPPARQLGKLLDWRSGCPGVCDQRPKGYRRRVWLDEPFLSIGSTLLHNEDIEIFSVNA